MTVARTRFTTQNRERPARSRCEPLYWLHNRLRGAEPLAHSTTPVNRTSGRNARGVSVTIREIQFLICSNQGVTRLDLLSRRRGKAAARQRQLGMWLARHLTPASLTEIGMAFGGRDHTTVGHAIWRIEQEIAGGSALGQRALRLRTTLEQGGAA